MTFGPSRVGKIRTACDIADQILVIPLAICTFGFTDTPPVIALFWTKLRKIYDVRTLVISDSCGHDGN
jgi:hypothetical protein